MVPSARGPLLLTQQAAREGPRILALQAALGNRYVARMIAGAGAEPLSERYSAFRKGYRLLQRQPASRPPATGTAPPQAPRPVVYDRNRHEQLWPLTSKDSKAELTTELNKKVKAQVIAGFAASLGNLPAGLSRDAAEQLLLKAILHVVNETKNLPPPPGIAPSSRLDATESHIVTPQGLILVHVDASGDAQAEFTKAAMAQAPNLGAADGKKELDQLGFKTLTGWGGRTNELNKVIGALRLLPAADVAVLNGYNGLELALIGAIDPTKYPGLTILPGDKPAALFYVDETSGKGTLLISNSVFDDDANQFFGGNPKDSKEPTLPHSYGLIVHEIGHAIERQPHQAAILAEAGAGAEKDRTERVRKDYASQTKRDPKETARLELDAERALQASNRAANIRADTSPVLLDLAQLIENARRNKEDADASASKLGCARLKGQDKKYCERILSTKAAIERFLMEAQAGSKPIDDLELAVKTSMDQRNDAAPRKVERGLTYAVVDQDNWFGSEVRVARGRNRPLQRFVEVVKANPGSERFTGYSSKMWELGKPEESFADARAMVLSDPYFMKNNYPAIYDFFTNKEGKYRP